VNTGWTGGRYGIGRRIDIPVTRAIIRAVQNGDLNQVAFQTDPVFGFEIPITCPGVPAAILDPATTWNDPAAYLREQRALATFFIERAAKLKLPPEVMAQNPKV
jgi:phosphoenolpyruvate carboxykinase (ATP)